MRGSSRQQFALVVTAKIIRTFGFGVLSVAFALYIADRGLSPFAVGAALTVALLAGSVTMLASPPLVRHLGRRGSLLTAAAVMTVAGVMLGLPGTTSLIFLACLLGSISVGGQEVGPFAAVEQLIVVESEADAGSARLFALYNLFGASALALGALAAAVIPTQGIPWAYAVCGLALVAPYSMIANVDANNWPTAERLSHSRLGKAELLAALFGLDALAGGFVVQSFLAYWLHLRFGVDQRTLGLLLFGANTLAALSYPAAAWLSSRIGLLRTMVFTHLPSNVLLSIVPLMPTFGYAAALLLGRFALSQMDVPTRQAFTMYAVPPDDRTRAAALTNAVRPAAAAVAPVFAGLAVHTAAIGLPFFLAGGLKIIYDLAVFQSFKRLPISRVGSSRAVL